jgi:hypothetical protein
LLQVGGKSQNNGKTMDAMMLVDGLMWPSGLTDSEYELNGSNISMQQIIDTSVRQL